MAGISGIDNNYFYGTNASGISTLLGSLGNTNGVSSLANVISDYNQIKTGTYGRLLKAYYGKQSSEETSSKKSSSADSSKNTMKESLSNIKSKTEKLSTAASKLAATDKDSSLFTKKLLKQADGTTTEGYDIDSIYGAVKDFTKYYNDVLDATVNNSTKSLASGADSLISTTKVMSSALKKMGITADLTGKLSIDEDKFKSYDVDKIAQMFNGKSSYASTIAQTAARIQGTSANKLSSISAMSYGKTATYKSSDNDLSSLFDSYY